MSDLVGNPEDRFSCDVAHLISCISGNFYPIQNWTVNAYCYLTIDHFQPAENDIEHLDIKTFGKVNVLTANDALTTLKGSTLTVRSGAEVVI